MLIAFDIRINHFKKDVWTYLKMASSLWRLMRIKKRDEERERDRERAWVQQLMADSRFQWQRDLAESWFTSLLAKARLLFWSAEEWKLLSWNCLCEMDRLI